MEKITDRDKNARPSGRNRTPGKIRAQRKKAQRGGFYGKLKGRAGYVLAAVLAAALIGGCGQREAKTGQETEIVKTETAETKTLETKTAETETSETVALDVWETESEIYIPAETEAEPWPDSEEKQTEETIGQDEGGAGHTAVLYIGMDGEYREYPFQYGDVLEPDALIEGIGELTGWDLSLAEPVISGKGGMTVVFSKDSSVFTGPPEEQKEEFFVYDVEQLVRTVLDSVNHTLKYNFIDANLGDPESLDIWFTDENGGGLKVPGLEMELPDGPYTEDIWQESALSGLE